MGPCQWAHRLSYFPDCEEFRVHFNFKGIQGGHKVKRPKSVQKELWDLGQTKGFQKGRPLSLNLNTERSEGDARICVDLSKRPS